MYNLNNFLRPALRHSQIVLLLESKHLPVFMPATLVTVRLWPLQMYLPPQCSRCQTMQVLGNCQQHHTARVDINNIKTITIFSPLLDKLCNGNVSSEILLLHPPFSVTVSDYVATSLS